LIAQRQREDPRGRYAFSGEDLSNVGPVALLQDLAVAATLGLTHVERNGHHYFADLGALPAEVQQQVLARHGDLYHRHETPRGAFPSLTIRGGEIALDSVVMHRLATASSSILRCFRRRSGNAPLVPGSAGSEDARAGGNDGGES